MLIGAIYWINLDRSTERRANMETLLANPIFQNIPITKRIPAIDGKRDTIYDRLIIDNHRNTKIEYACLLSHFDAIRTFVNDTTAGNIALILEDDMTLEFQPLWPKPLQDVIHDAPPDWEILQLCYITNGILRNDYTLNNYRKNSYGGIASMAAYLINRTAATKFINDTYNSSTDQYSLIDFHTHEADHYLYKCLRTYVYKYPYFIYPTDNDSTIHEDHLPSHIQSKMNIIKRLYQT